MKKLLAFLIVMVMIMAHTASASETASGSLDELVPRYSVYADVEPGMVTQLRLDDGNLADSYMYFDVSVEDWSNYVTYVREEHGYHIVADNFDTYEEEHWIELTFRNITFRRERLVTFHLDFYYLGGILIENYPIETTSGVSETTTASTPTFTPTPAPSYTACSHCIGGWIDCSTCGTFGMCRYCDGFGYRSRYTSDGYEYLDCNYCGGTGACSRCGYSGFLECTYCGGTGIQN